MARHTKCYFDQLGIEYNVWARSGQSAAQLSLAQVIQTCDVVLLLLNDRAVVPFVEKHPELNEKTLIHFSGSLVTDLAHGMHPLSTFGAELHDLETYRRVPFVCEPGAPTFAEIFPTLDNPWLTIPRELKPHYHALCVLAGNGTAMLWKRLFEGFTKDLGLPEEFALPYLRQTLRDLERNPGLEPTGPIGRGDRETLLHDLEAMTDDPFHDVLQALIEASAPDLLGDEP